MAAHTTEEAIKAATRCLQSGMPNVVIKHYLVQDGFDPHKAGVIVRWAYRIFQKGSLK